ncbi:MAG TPA: hypothetical protein VM925_01585 [Labilithrix sp.]|nr:hypothetical protein [Labilithrix sp.]
MNLQSAQQPPMSTEGRNQRRRISRIGGLLAVVAIAACDSTSGDGTNPNGSTPTNPPGSSGENPAFGTTDAGVTEQKCETLNIGIIGVPGENASSNFQSWLKNAGTTATRIHTERDNVLTSAALAPFDVVIIDHLMHDYSSDEAAAFQTWLSAGKGAVSMSGYLNAPEVDFRANALLAPLGVAYAGARFDGPITQFVPHPITQGLTSITFLGGYAVEPIDDVTSTRTAIASEGDRNVGYTVELGQGRAFVWGDEWIQHDSEWATLVEIQQLWLQIFAWLAPNRCKLNLVK